MPSLDELLRILARRGWWIEAWYPLTSEPVFECRITDGATGQSGNQWATNSDALSALHEAMVKAELVPRIVVLAGDEPWPPSVRSS